MKRIYKRLLNQTGAMDKIIVTLLFIVIGTAGVVGLISWTNTQKSTIQTAAENRIIDVRTETSTD